MFTRQFGTMINAGLPLIQCLDILSTQSENKVLRETVGDVKNSVEAGSTFSDALKKHPKVFDELYTNMIHAGEVGGLLDTILTRLAKHIEKAMKLKGQIKSAMVYPTAIVGVAVIVISVLMVWVIPVFAQMFLEMSGGKIGLPGPTQTGDQRQQLFPELLVCNGRHTCGRDYRDQAVLCDGQWSHRHRSSPAQSPRSRGSDQKSVRRQVHAYIGYTDHERRAIARRARVFAPRPPATK